MRGAQKVISSMDGDTEVPMADHPILSQLPAPERARLLAQSVQHRVRPGTILFDQGETPTFQQFLLQGSVHLYGRSIDDREVLIEVVEAPDLIIPAAVLTNTPYLMQARVVEDSTLLMIQASAFRSAVLSEPSLALALIGCLSGQFRRLVRQVKNLKLRSALQRVGCYLLVLAAKQGTPRQVVLPYEKNLIASQLGITRESFSRALAELQKIGIEVQGETIIITNPQRLADACLPDPLIDTTEHILQVPK
jgi:CRP/FNR family transcriptional activator FtrB